MADPAFIRDLDPVLAHKVEYFSHMLRRYLRLLEDDYQDYRQELYFQAMRAAANFDPTKGSWATFIEYVVHAQTITIMRKHNFRFAREIPMHRYIPTDDAYEMDDLRVTHLDGTPAPDDQSWAKTYSPGLETDSVDLVINVAAVLSALGPRQQRIARLLVAGYRTSDIADALGLPYTTVHYHVRAVRQLFIAQGIEPRVRNFSRPTRKKVT